jgi:hypothetical protein
MARSKKLKPGSRLEALAEALSALSARPLEVVLTYFGPLPEGTRVERRLISTIVATDKATVINVYPEEPVRDDAVPLAHASARGGSRSGA